MPYSPSARKRSEMIIKQTERPLKIALKHIWQTIQQKPPTPPRTWGLRADGTKYAIGLTVAQLRNALQSCNDSDEVCMVIKPYEGILGKLKWVEPPTYSRTHQVWLHGTILDESLEPRR